MSFQFYGLNEQPFGVTPNPRFLYRSPVHLEVLASLIYAIENDLGMSVLTAEPGLGKTTLLYYLLDKYRSSARTALLFQTQCHGNELLRFLAAEFEEPDETDPVRAHEQLKRLLAKEARAGKRVLVVVDEAQNLDTATLETVRLLSNFETRERKLLHIVLAGQKQLGDKLRDPALSQLLQRFTIMSHLRPFDSKETSEYIFHRLKAAGAAEPASIFSAPALKLIAEGSRGIPRDINRIGFNALSAGYALQRQVIGPDIISEVLVDLELAQYVARDDRRISTEPAPAGNATASNWNIDHWFEPESHRVHISDKSPIAAATPPVTALSESPSTAAAATLAPAAEPTRLVSSEKTPASNDVIEEPPREFDPPNPVEPERAVNSAAFEVLRPKLAESAEKLLAKRDSTYAYLAAFALLLVVAAGVLWIWHVTESKAATVPSQSKGAAAGLSSEEVELPASPPARSQKRRSAPAAKPGSNADVPHPTVVVPKQSLRPTALSPGSELAPKLSVAIPDSASRDQVSDTVKELVSYAEAPPLPPPAASARNSAGLLHAELLHMVKPVYPAHAREARLEGAVVLRLTIAADGSVSRISVVAGDEPLASAAVDAVKRWRYRPASMDGRPTEEQAEVTIYFRLDS